MSGSTYGKLFRITTWGESHGRAVGVVVDGCPAGLELSEDDIQLYLDRRRPGQNRYTTGRSEADRAMILSGVFEGRCTGTPVSIMVWNQDQHSRDYSDIAGIYRPGHADIAYDKKYGFRDYRGGGRSSGRETVGRVAAGAIASKILKQKGISLVSYVSAIGPVSCDTERMDPEHLKKSSLCMPDPEAEKEASAFLEECMKEKDSSGSVVECRITGLKAGVGEPVFDKLDALLGQAMFSIGAVKGVEIGAGFEAARMKGSENNDQYLVNEPVKAGNNAGGILGGISDGSEIRLRVAFKPTPSIARPQLALASDGTVKEIEVHGRHDPVIGPRACVVVESMAAVTIVDLIMRDMPSRLSGF